MPSSGVQTCALDRKSTRLNSSHTIISYAVFCLKKKCSRSEEHTSELQSHDNLVCRLLLEKQARNVARPPLPGAGRGGLADADAARGDGELGVRGRALPAQSFFFIQSGAPRPSLFSPNRALPR